MNIVKKFALWTIGASVVIVVLALAFGDSKPDPSTTAAKATATKPKAKPKPPALSPLDRKEAKLQRVVEADRDFGSFVTDVDLRDAHTAIAYTVWGSDEESKSMVRLPAREAANLVLDAGYGIDTVEIRSDPDGGKIATFR